MLVCRTPGVNAPAVWRRPAADRRRTSTPDSISPVTPPQSRLQMRNYCDVSGSSSGGAEGAEVGTGVSGTRKLLPHWLQRTFLPRADSGTCNTARHFRFGQSSVTDFAMLL